MACTLQQLRTLLEGEGLRYYLIPDHEGVMIVISGGESRYQFRILIEEDGQFLQFRSDTYLYCPVDHPNLGALLKVLGHENYRMRMVKYGWDPTDGEIAVYADLWLMDAELTQGQFGRMADAYISLLDAEYETFKAAIEDGVVPSDGAAAGEDREVIETL